MIIPEKLCGIIGWPLGHTMSPLLHNWGFAQLGLPLTYMAFPTPPDRLETFLAGVRALPVWGLSVTIPHKRAVMAACDHLTERAKAVGAVNTLYWRDGKLWGENTDVAGFLAPLHAQEDLPQKAIVLGAGGAARAAVAGLQELGLTVFVSARTLEKAQALTDELGGTPLPWEERTQALDGAGLVVNATPLGMSGERQEQSPWPAETWTPSMTAYDMVYNPLETRMLREAKAAGASPIDGLSMFVGQGLEQFRLWTGQELDEKEARSLLAHALGL